MVDIVSWPWAILAAAALLTGVSKTAIPGMGTLTVAVFAAVLPARESTAAVLMLLILADLFAIWTFRKDVDWGALKRLVPTVLVGLLVGAGFLALVDDTTMRRSIGIILLLLTGGTLWLRRSGLLTADSVLGNPRIRGAYGVLGGFTTMAANAGGPVMTLYFLAARFDVLRFMGTQAYFFFVVNVSKVPLQIGLGLLQASMIPLLLSLAPFVVVGALLGRIWIRRMDRGLFERIVVLVTIGAAIYLLV